MESSRPTGLARKLAANTLHAASGRVIGIILWLLLTPPMLRSLGADGFGIWSLFSALTGYLGALDFGFSQATLRSVSAAHAREEQARGGDVATLAVLGYVALGLLWGAVIPLVRGPVLEFLRVPPEVMPGASFAIVAGAVVFVLAGVAGTGIAILQGSGRFDLGNAALVTVVLVQAAGIVASMRFGWGLPGMVCATGAGWAAASLLALGAIRARVPAFAWAGPARAFARLGEVVRFGGPMQVGNVLGVIHQQVDKVFLSRFVALASVAPYELGLRVSTATSTFPQLMLLALTPAAAAMVAQQQYGPLLELMRRASRYVLALAAIGTGVVLGSAKPLFAAWLGAPSPDAERALWGLGVAAYFALAAGVTLALARGAGRTDLEARFSALALAIHLVLAFVLVPRMGLAGALVAIAVANAVALPWFLAALARVFAWDPWPLVLEPFGLPLAVVAAGAAAGMGLARAGLPGLLGAPWPHLVLVAGASALAGAAVAFGSGYVRPGELLSLLRPAKGTAA